MNSIPKSSSSPIIWYIGLSGAGKTTLATALAAELTGQGRQVKLLDGDELRKGLCAGLGFSLQDRMENIRRTAHLAAILRRCGITVIVATISPLESFRALARQIVPQMIEVFVDTPLALCEARDPKGLYRLARAGTLKNFTGLDSPFEPPIAADITCRTDQQTIAEATAQVLAYISLQA